MPVSNSVYWRRRCVALMIVLSILALIVWVLAGALGGSAPAGSPAATRPVSGAPASASAGPSTQGAPAAGLPAAGKPAANYGLQPCPAGDVVLSLFSSQASYSLRETPQFEVDVVSTASRSCAFNIGASHVLLQVSAGGKLIWTSADCAEGQASLVTTLHRGVPTVVPITWDGQHSSPGCPVPGAAAPAGTYSATARDGSLASNALTFSMG